jgi:hypothetical protein
VHGFQFLFAVALASPETLVEQVRRQGANGIQVHRVQLDADAPLECVVQYELPDSGVHAVVLDSRGSEWREVGRYNAWWNYTKRDSERFLEFRQIAETGVNDVIVRTRSGGTEEARTTVEIHRMQSGAMVNVLNLTEYSSAMEHPSGDVFTTVTRLSYSPGRVVSDSTKNPGGRRTCQVYIWNAARFRFEEDTGASGASCP